MRRVFRGFLTLQVLFVGSAPDADVFLSKAAPAIADFSGGELERTSGKGLKGYFSKFVKNML